MDDIIFEESFLRKVINVLSDHFEVLIYVNGSILLGFLIILVALIIKDLDIKKFLRSVFQNALYLGVVAGQCTLFIVFGSLYWQNYQRLAPELTLRLDRDVQASTHWVKNDTRIHFIDDNILRSVKINDRDSEDVFVGKNPIKEYHFSPNGKHLIILTQKELFLLDRKAKQSRRIDTLEPVSTPDQQGKGTVVKGSISGIQWAPDSKKFVYEIARWSKFSVQDDVYLYILDEQTKKAIKSPARRISSLYWDRQGENLYYFHHEAQDTSVYPSAFEVKVFRISLTTLTPELIARIPFDEMSVPVENLDFRGIDLFLDGGRFSFGRPGRENNLISETGSSLGIDDDDFLYFVSAKWFRKRLYKIPREPRDTDIPRYQYKGGDLIVDHIRWVPGGRYVIMEHKYWGVLILEPSTGKIGLLIRANGHAFGWYENSLVKR